MGCKLFPGVQDTNLGLIWKERDRTYHKIMVNLFGCRRHLLYARTEEEGGTTECGNIEGMKLPGHTWSPFSPVSKMKMTLPFYPRLWITGSNNPGSLETRSV